MVLYFACLIMICLIPTHYKVPMSENTPKNNVLFPQVENAQSSSKTDLFQLEFPLFITTRLLAKKSSGFLGVSTISLLYLNLLKCPMHEEILPYVLAHILENNPL
jgi:hypothetical protein